MRKWKKKDSDGPEVVSHAGAIVRAVIVDRNTGTTLATGPATLPPCPRGPKCLVVGRILLVN